MLADFFAPLGPPRALVGGGLGVAYVDGEESPSITAWADAVAAPSALPGRARCSPRTAEPDRAIAPAEVAVTVYRIGTIKSRSRASGPTWRWTGG